MNFLANSRQQYVKWVELNNPVLYRAAMANMRAGMAGDDPGFWSKAFDAISSIGTSVYGAKLQSEADKKALAQITAENKAAAIAAQQQAVDTIAREQYAQQIRALQQQQLDAERSSQDTALMLGGIVLAALVGAKLLKVI